MKKIFLAIFIFANMTPFLFATSVKDITLLPPQKDGGKNIMQTLSERKSTREFSAKELNLQTLSNLLWAANGINRPDGKRTAASAMNRQEIDVYACISVGEHIGAYKYNAQENILQYLSKGKKCQQRNAPITLYLVVNADISSTYSYIDGGIVSANISLFCSGNNLATVPQGSMDKKEVAKTLRLNDKQFLLLNHPVGFFKE